ncbi:MAG: PEP-CTERM sorting domain-containing protein [Pirellulales bacterium]
MRTLTATTLLLISAGSSAWAGPFSPPAGQPGSTAMAASDAQFVGWAVGFGSLVRGPLDIANPGGGLASFGSGGNALGPADATPSNTAPVVSLGDGGAITLSFARPITDGPGFDFAVFENGFADEFLELAFVEVSTNGTDFVRFPAISLTQTATQVGGFGTLDATDLHNLAGKYRAGYGTPFDLSEVAGLSATVNAADVNFVRLVDVVGSINPALGTQDSLGNPMNDPYPTAFSSGGFDLDAVGVIHAIPEPAGWVLLSMGVIFGCLVRRRRRRPVN